MEEYNENINRGGQYEGKIKSFDAGEIWDRSSESFYYWIIHDGAFRIHFYWVETILQHRINAYGVILF